MGIAFSKKIEYFIENESLVLLMDQRFFTSASQNDEVP